MLDVPAARENARPPTPQTKKETPESHTTPHPRGQPGRKGAFPNNEFFGFGELGGGGGSFRATEVWLDEVLRCLLLGRPGVLGRHTI